MINSILKIKSRRLALDRKLQKTWQKYHGALAGDKKTRATHLQQTEIITAQINELENVISLLNRQDSEFYTLP